MHRCGLRQRLGERVHSMEEVSNLLLSRQCMRFRALVAIDLIPLRRTLDRAVVDTAL